MRVTRTKKLTVLAILTAVSLILFLVEALVPLPVPLPGIKLGLSNIVTTCLLFLYGWQEAAAVLLLRIFLGAVITGQLGALAYSLCGGMLSMLVLILLRPSLKDKPLWIAGVTGGALHNIGQIAAAILIAQTPSLIVYLPLLLAGGMLAGLFTGLCAQLLHQRLKKFLHSEDPK